MKTLEQFFGKMSTFVLEQNGLTPIHHQSTIKQHTEKLPLHGDFGFPIAFQAWSHLVEDANGFDGTRKVIDKHANHEFIKKLIELSSEWGFPIKEVKFQPFRCLFFLNREQCFRNILKTVIFDDASYGQWHRSTDQKYRIDIKSDEESNLTKYRCGMVAKVLSNLLHASGFETIPCDNNADGNDLVDILVTSARRDGERTAERPEFNNNAETRTVFCGAVKSKICQSANDFIE